MGSVTRSSPVLRKERGRFLTRGRLILVLVAYISLNVGVYLGGGGFKDDKRFFRTVINVLTATFER